MGRSHINVAAGMVTCLMAITSEARPVESWQVLISNTPAPCCQQRARSGLWSS